MRSPALLHCFAMLWLVLAAWNIHFAIGPTPDGWFHLVIAAACVTMAVLKIIIARERQRARKP